MKNSGKMKKIISGITAFIFSLAGAFIGAMIAVFIYYIFQNTAAALSRVILNGLFFLFMYTGGFAGMNFAFRLQKVTIYKSAKQTFKLVLSGVLIFALAAGGQYLFMRNKTETLTEGSVDVVLLLDGSGSMELGGYTQPRTDAAVQFIESLDEDTYLQVVTYGDFVINRFTTELLAMDSSNKAAAEDLIASIDTEGGTNYDAALKEAMDTLTGSSARSGSVKAVILLTDGDTGDLSESVISDFEDSGIILFTIRIADSSSASSTIDDLINLAAGSGGSDTVLVPDSNGDVDASEMLAAFEAAFEDALETTIEYTGDIMIVSQTYTGLQFIIFLIVLVICGIFFGMGYYGKTGKKFLIINVICGIVCALFMLFVLKTALKVFIVSVLLGAAFVSLDLEIKDPENEAGPGGYYPEDEGGDILHV